MPPRYVLGIDIYAELHAMVTKERNKSIAWMYYHAGFDLSDEEKKLLRIEKDKE